MKRLLGCSAVIAVLAAMPGPARACGAGTVLFADDFQHPEPYWDVTGANVTLQAGALRIEPPQNANWFVYYPGMPYMQADACVTLSIGAFHAAGDIGAGILFWVNDREHNDVFMIRPDGGWVIAQHDGHQWVALADGTSEAIHRGRDALNEVEVRLDGRRGEAWVNGTRVAAFEGEPPRGRAAFGFYAESEVDESDVWTFHAMQVRRLEQRLAPPDAAAPAGRPGVTIDGRPDPG